MYQTSIEIELLLNKIHNKISSRTDTIAESLILARPDLVLSNNDSRILMSTHNLCDSIVDIFSLAIETFQYIKKHPKTRFILITPSYKRSIQFQILSRFKHIDHVIDTDRLTNIFSIIDALSVTKIIYCNPGVLNTTEQYPPIHIYNQDILMTHKYFPSIENKDILLVSNTFNTLSKFDAKKSADIIKTLSVPCISLSNVRNIYLPKNKQFYYINNTDIDRHTIISICIGLLSHYSYMCITPREINLFDLLRKCI